jgi:hypothetical protein
VAITVLQCHLQKGQMVSDRFASVSSTLRD